MASNVWSNWSGGVTAKPAVLSNPGDEDELSSLLRAGATPCRVTGAGHSFTPLCETSGTLFSLSQMSGLLSCDKEKKTARVRAGTSIRDLGPLLHAAGLGLLNQGDIDRQAIAGAVGTGTHGTGKELKSLSGAVSSLRLVTPTGDVLTCSRDENSDVYSASRVSMGTLGIMSEIELQCRASYVLEERGGRMSVADLFSSIEQLRDKNRHFEFFWFPFADDVLIKTLNKVDGNPKARRRAPDGAVGPADLAFLRLCEISRFAPFLRGRFQKQMTDQGGARYSGDEPGRTRWSHDAFPSDRNVRFNEMEYAIPAELGPDCVQEVAKYMRECGANFLFPIEYRYVAADDIWLSPFFERDSVTISIHQYHKQSYKKLFHGVEAIFQRYGGRPHWGKIHNLQSRELCELYPNWEKFCDIRAEIDPKGKMLNSYLRSLFEPA
jgi:FAD-linked oxidoreductase